MDDRARSLLRMLRLVLAAFAAAGVAFSLAGRSPLFAVWNRAAALALFDLEAPPPELVGLASATDAILGMAMAGKWLAALAVVQLGVAAGRRWAADALLAALAAWFAVDSAASLLAGATFNVLLVNLPGLVLPGGLLLVLRSSLAGRPALDVPLPWNALALACLLVSASALPVALGAGTPLLAPWESAAASAFYPALDALPYDALRWLQLALGAIGGTVLGHFLLLAIVVRRCGDARERWALATAAATALVSLGGGAALAASRGLGFQALVVAPPLAAVLLLAAVAFATARR